MENIGYIELCLLFEQADDGLREVTLQPMQAIAPLIIGASVLCGTSLIQPEAAQAIAPGETIQLGSQGEKVEEIQTHLRDWGFPLNPKKRLAVDGVFGEATKAAVLEFQQYHKLKPDGIVGNATYPILSNPPDYSSQNLKLGDVGDRVQEIQTHLRDWNVFWGEADGIFGSQTQNAVIRFQEYHGFQPKGIVDSRTYTILSNSTFKEIDDYLNTLNDNYNEKKPNEEIRNTKEKLKVYSNIGNHPLFEGRLLNALGISYMFKAVGGYGNDVTTYATSAGKEINQENLALAEQYFKQAQSIFKDLDHKTFEAFTWKNLGTSYSFRGKYDEARNSYQKALNKLNEPPQPLTNFLKNEQKSERGGVLKNVGMSYYAQGLFTLSHNGFREVIPREDTTLNNASCKIISTTTDNKEGLFQARKQFILAAKELSSALSTFADDSVYYLLFTSLPLIRVSKILSCTIENIENGEIDRSRSRSKYREQVQNLDQTLRGRIAKIPKGQDKLNFLQDAEEVRQPRNQLIEMLPQLIQEFERFQQADDLSGQLNTAETLLSAARTLANASSPDAGGNKRVATGSASGP